MKAASAATTAMMLTTTHLKARASSAPPAQQLDFLAQLFAVGVAGLERGLQLGDVVAPRLALFAERLQFLARRWVMPPSSIIRAMISACGGWRRSPSVIAAPRRGPARPPSAAPWPAGRRRRCPSRSPISSARAEAPRPARRKARTGGRWRRCARPACRAAPSRRSGAGSIQALPLHVAPGIGGWRGHLDAAVGRAADERRPGRHPRPSGSNARSTYALTLTDALVGSIARLCRPSVDKAGVRGGPDNQVAVFQDGRCSAGRCRCRRTQPRSQMVPAVRRCIAGVDPDFRHHQQRHHAKPWRQGDGGAIGVDESRPLRRKWRQRCRYGRTLAVDRAGALEAPVAPPTTRPLRIASAVVSCRPAAAGSWNSPSAVAAAGSAGCRAGSKTRARWRHHPARRSAHRPGCRRPPGWRCCGPA